MALVFADNTTDDVNHGSTAALDDMANPTIAFIFKPTNNSNTFRSLGGKGTNLEMFRRGVDGTRIAISRSMSGTDAVVDVSTGLLTTGWNFAAFTCDWLVDLHSYHGAYPTPCVDTTFNEILGTGTLDTDAAADWTMGSNQGSLANGAIPYTIAWVGVWNRILTLGELQDQQFNPHVTSGCVLFSHYGWNGTGTQADWSGGVRNGTVTGATLSTDHAPIQVRPRVWTPSRRIVAASTLIGARSLHVPSFGMEAVNG